MPSRNVQPRNYTPPVQKRATLNTRSAPRFRPASIPSYYDARNSSGMIWSTLFPFIILEFIIEKYTVKVPSGLAFPTSYVLFWAFFFTFYRPHFLDNNLDTLTWGKLWLMAKKFFSLKNLKRKPALTFAKPVQFAKPLQISKPVKERQPQTQTTTKLKLIQPEVKQAYSPELCHALSVLGLGAAKPLDWDIVHRRYRLLARKLHPDLNPMGTQGRRFIQVDQAYKYLLSKKNLFRQ